MTEKRTGTRPASIKPRVQIVDHDDESTMDDDQEAPGQTNVDSPQGADLPGSRAYRVLVNHDQHTVEDVIVLAPGARTMALVNQGYLEPLD